ncbi:MAG TPA: sugar kinase [Puia sp.]
MFHTASSGTPRLAAFGEFMLRLHSMEGRRFLQAGPYQPYYAGAEANTCVLLSRLGIPVRYITRLPDNDIAQAGVGQLRGQGVDTSHIVYGGDKMGVYFTEQGNGIRSTRVIYDRHGSSYARLQPGVIDWKNSLAGVALFHWSGISAAVSPGAAEVCEEALSVALEAGITISTDFNYRTTLWKYGKHPREVMPGLMRYTRVAVADLDSANVYFDIDTDPAATLEDRFIQCSQALRERLPQLEVLAMSFRKTQGIQHNYSGALLYKGAYYFSSRLELPFVTDQIGSGDAFTGGMLYGLMTDAAPQQIIDFATACGAIKQSIPGDWALISKRELDQFIHSGPTGRIIR